MKLISAFGKSFLPSVVGLLVGGYVASALVVFVDSIGNRSFVEELTGIPSSALMFSIYALIFAAPAMLMIHWPSYSYLLHKGHANYFTSAYVPGLFSLLAAISISVKFAVVVATYALSVAWTVHWLQVRSNSSFKPNPLRGSA